MNKKKDHSRTLTCMNNLGSVLQEMGKLEEVGDYFDVKYNEKLEALRVGALRKVGNLPP